MSFELPTLTQLRKQVRDDLNAALPGADSRLSQGILRVTGDVFAGLVYGLYVYLRWKYKQLFTDTADEEALVRDGESRGVYRIEAAFATGTITATGTTGAVIPADTELATKSGVVLLVTTETVIAAGVANVPVTAKRAGGGGNLEPAVALSFTTALSGVNAAAVVAAPGLVGGADIEGLEDYRARVLARKRQTPQGGADFDYVAWAKDVAGVTRAWVYRREQGAGTVTVRFMMDDIRAADGGIPQGNNASDYDAGSGDQALVFQHVSPLRPVTADLFVVAPEAAPLDLTISVLKKNTPAAQAAIVAELRDLLRRDAVPGGTIYRSRLIEAISLATGESHHTLTVPAADVAHAPGHIAVLGDIIWPA